jgi:DNA-binding GntR family transcriptional regulator
MRFQLKPLRSAADAAAAIASMAAAVAAGDITPSEAAELSALVEAFLYAIETSEFDQRLQVIEDKHAKKDRRRA